MSDQKRTLHPNCDNNMNTLTTLQVADCQALGALIQCDKVPNGVKGSNLQTREIMRHQQKTRHEILLSPGQGSSMLTKSRPISPDNQEISNFTKLKERHVDISQVEQTEDEHEPVTQDNDEDEEIICEDEADKRNGLPVGEALQKLVCLVKLYAWIKEEMSRGAARSVASHLYQHEGSLLSRSHHESICRCKYRREAVQELLSRVVKGPDDMYDVFVRALKSQEEGHIADKILSTNVTEDEIAVFCQLHESSLHQCSRPNCSLPRLNISDSDYNTLQHYLNDKTTIDCLNDHFLSRFLFSIREHTNICNTDLGNEARVSCLLDTMKLCADSVFEDFCEIVQLEALRLGYVIQKLEKRTNSAISHKQRKKRKANILQGGGDGDDDDGASTAPKRMCVSSMMELQIVSSLQRSPSSIRQEALDQLGFDVENINKGSIVIQLCPKSPDSWQRLEENCQTGRIKDFIPKIYNNEDIYDILQEGEYELKFTIYTLPAAKNVEDEKKILLHLETAPEKSTAPRQPEPCQENPIEDHMDLLCEELEISKDLIALLKKEKILEDGIDNELAKQGARAKKIRYLLKKISVHGTKGYEILKSYIKEDNEDLYKELTTGEAINTIGDKLPQVAKLTKRSRPMSGGQTRKEVFFTCTVVLKVEKRGTETKTKGQGPLEISCPRILDPVCYFEDKETKEDKKPEELTMVLEEAWVPPGARTTPKRDILIGKRKFSEKKTAAQNKNKKQHSTEKDEEVSETERGKLNKTEEEKGDTTESNVTEGQDSVEADGEQPDGVEADGDDKKTESSKS